jgi:hypothetical protein
VRVESGLPPDVWQVIAIHILAITNTAGFNMWSRAFGPSTTPIREVKSELLLQIERDLLWLVEHTSSPAPSSRA